MIYNILTFIMLIFVTILNIIKWSIPILHQSQSYKWFDTMALYNGMQIHAVSIAVAWNLSSGFCSMNVMTFTVMQSYIQYNTFLHCWFLVIESSTWVLAQILFYKWHVAHMLDIQSVTKNMLVTFFELWVFLDKHVYLHCSAFYYSF